MVAIPPVVSLPPTATGFSIITGGTIFTQTADSDTVPNTTSTLFGTGNGTLLLPANFLIQGRSIRILMGGYHSVGDGAAAIKTLTLTFGGVTVATAPSRAAFQTNLSSGWFALAGLTCRSV